MVKLKMVSMHKIQSIPDHIVHQVQQLAEELTRLILSHTENVTPNIVLASLNLLFPVILAHLVKEDPDELIRAAQMCCVSILKNMEALIAGINEKD